jgi:hypothetical protein
MAYGRNTPMRDTPMGWPPLRDIPVRWPMRDARLWNMYAYEIAVYEAAPCEMNAYER